MSIEFFMTAMGRRFYENDVPEMIQQLKRIADALEKIADDKNKEPPTVLRYGPAGGSS